MTQRNYRYYDFIGAGKAAEVDLPIFSHSVTRIACL